MRTITTGATRTVRPAQSVTSLRKRSVAVTAAKGSSAPLAEPVDANSLRVVDTELHVEAQQSYLAVSSLLSGATVVRYMWGIAALHRRQH